MPFQQSSDTLSYNGGGSSSRNLQGIVRDTIVEDHDEESTVDGEADMKDQ